MGSSKKGNLKGDDEISFCDAEHSCVFIHHRHPRFVCLKFRVYLCFDRIKVRENNPNEERVKYWKTVEQEVSFNLN